MGVRSVDGVPGFAKQQLEMYGWAENIISSMAGIDGKACIQRLICELSEVPLREKSFMGYILHTIIEPLRQRHLLGDYIDAQNQGLTYGACPKSFGRCPFTIRSLMSSAYISDTLKRKKR